MTAPEATPEALREIVRLWRTSAPEIGEPLRSMLLGVAGMIESAASRIESIESERATLHTNFADLRDQRDAALAQLSLARPIAEACARYADRIARCLICMGAIDEHAADCPVPAWIAGRK